MKTLGLSHAVVVKLLQDWRGKSHHIYTDSFYTSPQLYQELKVQGFEACGTVRDHRKGMPPEFSKCKMYKGELKAVVLQSGVLAIKWMDKRLVTLLTTIHDSSCVHKQRRSRHAPGGTEVVNKPIAIEEYNTYMGGVDKSDQLLSYYGFCHRTFKWWRRAFFHLLDVAVVNAYIMYQQSAQGPKLTHKMFRVELAKEMLLYAGLDTQAIPRTPSLPLSSRLTERHFLEKIPPTKSGKPTQQDCSVCSKRKEGQRVTTTFRCKQCQKALCVVPCFELHHTHQDPRRHARRSI